MTNSELGATRVHTRNAVASGRDLQGAGANEISDPKATRDVDIPSAVAWLRSFLDPEYTADGGSKKHQVPGRPFPPRKMILGFPGVRINWGVPSLPPTEMYCIMTQCEVTYDGFFGDGTPRMARVDLAFAEIIQIKGQIVVHDAADRRYVGENGYVLTDKAIKDTIK